MSEEPTKIGKITFSFPVKGVTTDGLIEALQCSLEKYRAETGEAQLCSKSLASSVFGTPVTVTCVRQEGHHGDHKGEVFWINEEGGSY